MQQSHLIIFFALGLWYPLCLVGFLCGLYRRLFPPEPFSIWLNRVSAEFADTVPMPKPPDAQYEGIMAYIKRAQVEMGNKNVPARDPSYDPVYDEELKVWRNRVPFTNWSEVLKDTPPKSTH